MRDDVCARLGPAAVVLSGGPASSTAAESPRAPEAVYRLGVPVLGICYGEQTMCAQLGGGVEQADRREYGRAMLVADRASPLLDGILAPGEQAPVWMSHGDKVTALPPGFVTLAHSEASPFAAIADEERRFYGVQFHPEVVHTPIGADLLRNFAYRIAGLKGDWSVETYRAQAVARVRDQVGGAGVICGLSGGVDSAVTALLVHEAVGDQLTCVFVDTGLLRHGEAKEVVDLFRGHFNIPLVHVPAAELFLGKLAGVTDPERKRKVIGGTFIDVFEAEARKLEDVRFLAQGTLYPDVIESVSFKGPSVTIKSHHNVGGLPERMNLGLVEPLRELFKDEARALGRELGLPETFIRATPSRAPASRSASRARSRRSGWRCCSRRTASSSRRSAPPASTTGLAGLRRAAAGQDRGRDGRRADLRGGVRAPRRDLGGRHDGRLLPLRARLPRPGREPDRERGQGHQPGRLRLHQQAARHDRVGVSVGDRFGI